MKSKRSKLQNSNNKIQVAVVKSTTTASLNKFNEMAELLKENTNMHLTHSTATKSVFFRTLCLSFIILQSFKKLDDYSLTEFAEKMAFAMRLFMSLVLTWVNTGLTNGFLERWLYAFGVGLCVAFPISILIAPLANRILNRLVNN